MSIFSFLGLLKSCLRNDLHIQELRESILFCWVVHQSTFSSLVSQQGMVSSHFPIFLLSWTIFNGVYKMRYILTVLTLTESAQLSKTGIPVYRLIVCHILIWPAHTFIHFTEMTLCLINRYTALVHVTEIREQLHHFCNSSILYNKGL